MSLPSIAIAGAAVALLAPSAAQACPGGAGFAIDGTGLAILGVVATITLPIWVAPAIGYGIFCGAKKVHSVVKDGMRKSERRKALKAQIALARQRRSESAAVETEQLKPYFEEAHKNPTPLSLLRLGVHLSLVGDLMSARRFLRKCLTLAKSNDPASSGLSDPQLLPLLALANNQLGEIQFRLHIYDEAYDYFAECKRLLDQLAKLAPAVPATGVVTHNNNNNNNTVGNNDDDDDDSDDDEGEIEEGETFLSESQVHHDLAWALFHKALYPKVSNLNYDKKTDLAALASATEQLAKWRSVSDTYELHYAIAQFFNKTQHFLCSSPDASSNARERTRFLGEEMAMFEDDFWGNVAPLFYNLCNKYQDQARDGTPEHYMYLIASSYLARCYYIKGDAENLRHARSCVERVRTQLYAIKDYDRSLDLDFSAVEKAVDVSFDLGDAASPRERKYKIIRASAFIPPLRTPHGVNCGTAPHSWQKYKCKFLSFCQHCQKFINWDQNQDGVFRCEHCDFIAHTNCKDELGEDAVCAVASNRTSMEEHVHVMKKTLLGKPTWCSHCKDYIKNPFGAFACSICAAEVHESCLEKMGNVLMSVKK